MENSYSPNFKQRLTDMFKSIATKMDGKLKVSKVVCAYKGHRKSNYYGSHEAYFIRYHIWLCNRCWDCFVEKEIEND